MWKQLSLQNNMGSGFFFPYTGSGPSGGYNKEVDETGKLAFHGTWWYGLENTLRLGTLLPSEDLNLGHECWEVGVCLCLTRTGHSL